MQIFTELGIDTGFPKGRTFKKTNGDCGGCYEKKVRGSGVKRPLPYVIKEPQMCADIDLRIEALKLDVDHVYILLRRPGPQAAALEFMKSRKRGGSLSRHDPYKLWFERSLNGRDLESMTDAIATRELQVVNLVAELDVPHTLVSYPRFASDLDYAYSKFRFILEKHDISKKRFKKVCNVCINKDIVDAAYADMPEWYRASMREAWNFRPRIKRGF
jgi:REP element-mobilizing transposase RayT